MRAMKGIGLLGVGAAFAAACATGSAASAGTHATREFAGTCHFQGTLTEDPPLTTTSQNGTAVAIASGACDGTLTKANGRWQSLDSAPVDYFGQAESEGSCGYGTSTGAGYLRFGRKRLDFLFSETRVIGLATIRLTGRAGGGADGLANISAEENPVAVAQACSSSGLASAQIEINLSSQGISG